MPAVVIGRNQRAGRPLAPGRWTKWPSLPRTHSINPDARRSVQPFQNAAVSTMLASRTGFVACQHGVAESLPRDMTAAVVVCGSGIVKLFGNACRAADVSGLGGERWWLTASFKPLRR